MLNEQVMDPVNGERETKDDVKTKVDRNRQLAETLRFNTDRTFHEKLHHAVDEYFRSTGRQKRGGWQIYIKSCVILACFFLSYLLLVFLAQNVWQGLVLAIILSSSITAIGFNIQHDGGHQSFSDHRLVNRLAAMTMDLVGASSYMWHWKHAMFHHNYVNITGYDPDIDLGGLGRLSPHQEWLWFYRWQHLYMWVLYGLLVVKWQLFDDLKNLMTGRIYRHRMPRPKGTDLLIFIAGKLSFVTLAFMIPLFYHPPGAVVFFYLVTVLTMGVPLSIVFQLPHCMERADFPLPVGDTGLMENPWAVHQARVTLDFDRYSPVRTWLLGGLNFHIEHHLFLGVCHTNYPGISKLVEEACRQAGVEYAEHSSIWAGLAEHYRWLKKMGMPDHIRGLQQ